jgi:D-xylose transport system substrate-binding protein
VQLGKGETPKSNATLNNGKKEVPSFLLTPIPVDKNNIESTVVADGFHKKSDL